MNVWTRFACIGMGLAVWMTSTGGSAQAQLPGDRSQVPGFSPYLNLRGSTNPAITYYGIVRPEITFGNSLYQLGVQQDMLQGQQTALGNQQSALAAYTTLPATGHRAGFQTQSRYFMTNGSQGAGGTGFAPGGFGMGPQMPGGMGPQMPGGLGGGGAFQPR